jgi:RNA polymerase sigma-70 factor, ECF subfamily
MAGSVELDWIPSETGILSVGAMGNYVADIPLTGLESDDPVLPVDAADIQATLNGEEEGYARLVRRYEGIIGTQMWRFTRDPQAHEELVQEVFVEGYTSLHSFKGKAPFEHWIRRIATRVGYRYWRNESRERDRRRAIEEWRATAAFQPSDPTPSQAAECLFRLLETLPPKDRLVLTLFYFEGWDMGEIADRVGWSRTLVKVRAHRARRKLRALLEDEGFSASGSTPDALGEAAT